MFVDERVKNFFLNNIQETSQNSGSVLRLGIDYLKGESQDFLEKIRNKISYKEINASIFGNFVEIR